MRRRFVHLLLAAAVTVVTAALIVAPSFAEAASPLSSSGVQASLASLALSPLPTPTPYMGVDTWYAFGPDIDQSAVAELTDALVSSGLRSAGYRYVWLDAGWWDGTRDRQGQIVLDRGQWPDGMRRLTSYIHSRGLLAGIYTDAGRVGCDNGGSYGHYAADIDRFAAWGFDAVKVDFCGAHTLGLSQRAVYERFSRAVRRDHPSRSMLLAISNGAFPGEAIYGDPSYGQSAYSSYSFASKIAASWRTGPDLGWPGNVDFGAVLRNIAVDAWHPGSAGRGHWNDPDYLVPNEGMTLNEFKAQFTMWTMLAAPLMVSADVSQLPLPILQVLRNRWAIAINQDPLGRQARYVASENNVQVWVKSLAGGERAVAFLNTTSRPATALATRPMIGLRTACRLLVRGVWAGTSERGQKQVRARLQGDSADLFLVSRACRRHPHRKR